MFKDLTMAKKYLVKAIAWIEKQSENKLEKYINDERNKKDFYYSGNEVSWNEMPLDVRKHDYPYYFNGDLDCYPFNVEKQGEQKHTDTDNKFIRMRETKPKDISEFLDRLTTVEQEFLWEHIAKIRELDKEEQTPTDKAEPKFKVGDWVVRDDTIAQIFDIQEQYYIGLDINGKDFTSSRFLNDDKIHLWTIQDAKDGDVLITGNKNIFIFKSINGNTIYDYCGLYFGTFMDFSTKVNGVFAEQLPKDYVPATKEQRDLLFQKMREEGYEWDAEKKELKKIEQKPTEDVNLLEFESYLCLMLQKFRTKEMCTNGEIIDYVKENSQKLRDILVKSALSEEDEEHVDTITSLLEDRKKEQTDWGAEVLNEEIAWLKSISPQSQWKPSDEQMEALYTYIYNPQYFNSPDPRMELVESVYKDLKKLKGE